MTWVKHNDSCWGGAKFACQVAPTTIFVVYTHSVYSLDTTNGEYKQIKKDNWE